jgi:GNAT superfamily N-acetyltransferase
LAIIRLTNSEPLSYFQEVARLHTAEIQHGILPLLGNEFLTTLYYEMCREPRNGIWVATEKEKILGFLAGCADVRLSCRRLALQSGLPLGWKLLHSMPDLKILKKFFSLFAYPFRKRGEQLSLPERHSSSEDRAELLAMAVHHEAHRQGIGRALVATFEESLLIWGGTDGYWVATDAAQMGSNNFYLSLGFEPSRRIKHHDLILQHYYKRLRGRTVGRNG